MRKYAIFMVLMALVIAFTSSCGLIVKDPEVDAQTVIIDVAGKTFTKTEVLQAADNILDYQAYMYSMYGMNFDPTDADAIASARESAISGLVEQAVLQQKIQELGMDQFTDEEMTAINEKVAETYQSNLDSVKSYYFADTELTGDELNAALEAKMQEVGYGSKDSILDQEKTNASMDKLKNSVIADVAVSDQEIEDAFNTNVTNAISTYSTTPTQYASDVQSGAILYFTPPGYRYVKNLLIKISDDDKAAIQSLSAEIADKQSSLSANQAAIAELPEDPAEDTEDQAKSREELTALSDTLTTDIADLTVQLNETTAAAYEAIQPTVDEVVAKLDAGEDFDALLETYGQDPGMTVEPQKTTGYLVCDGLSTYVASFVNAAMALENIGDVSQPFQSDSGIHIVQYTSDLQDGDVQLSEVRDQLQAELLSSKQDQVYDETVNQWIADAKAKTYPDKLAD